MAGSRETRGVKCRSERRQSALLLFVQNILLMVALHLSNPCQLSKFSKFDRGNYIGDFDHLFSSPYCLRVVPISRRNAPLIWRVPVMEMDSITLSALCSLKTWCPNFSYHWSLVRFSICKRWPFISAKRSFENVHGMIYFHLLP